MNLLTKTVLIVAASLCLMLLFLHEVSERVLLYQHDRLEDTVASRSLDRVLSRLENARDRLYREQRLVLSLLADGPGALPAIQGGLVSCLVGTKSKGKVNWLLNKGTDPSLARTATALTKKWPSASAVQRCRLFSTKEGWYLLAGLQGSSTLYLVAPLPVDELTGGDRRLVVEIAEGDGRPVSPRVRRLATGERITHRLLTGFDNTPSFMLVCRLPGEIASLGKRSALYLMLAILCTGCALGLGVVWLLRSQVLSRIRLLQGQLRKVQSDAGTARLLSLSGQDEVSELALAINRTLSSLLETEGTLRRQEEALQQAQRIQSLGVLAAGVAHEINNPLHSLQLNLGVLQRMITDGRLASSKEVAEIVSDLETEVRHIAGTVSRMRELARPGGSGNLESLDLNDAVAEALSLVRAQVESHGIVLTDSLSPELPAVVANAHDLKQALINIVANARQALDGERGSHILVRTEEQDGVVRLQVEDNGPGLPENPDRVFDPFFSTKDVGEGMGMGLAVVYSHIARWGGRIEADTGSLGGARFTISFKGEVHENPSGG